MIHVYHLYMWAVALLLVFSSFRHSLIACLSLLPAQGVGGFLPFLVYAQSRQKIPRLWTSCCLLLGVGQCPGVCYTLAILYKEISAISSIILHVDVGLRN